MRTDGITKWFNDSKGFGFVEPKWPQPREVVPLLTTLTDYEIDTALTRVFG